ncbi:MAG: DNA repair protein RecO [Candidatus Omnitrophota bacterium]
MAIQKCLAFVLKREEVRETSILLTVYTEEFGKLKLISKGVRSPEQRFISPYEIYSLIEIVFYERKKRGYFLLSQCELIDFFPGIRESLERISYATYFIELLNGVSSLGDKNTKLFDLLSNSLQFLSSKASPKRVARIFEIKLLSVLGLMPRIKTCVNCDEKPQSGIERFSLAMGGILCSKCFNADTKARPMLRGTVNFITHIENLPFEKVKHIKVATRVGIEVEDVLKNFIYYHLDIRPKSRMFIEKIGV